MSHIFFFLNKIFLFFRFDLLKCRRQNRNLARRIKSISLQNPYLIYNWSFRIYAYKRRKKKIDGLIEHLDPYKYNLSKKVIKIKVTIASQQNVLLLPLTMYSGRPRHVLVNPGSTQDRIDSQI